MDQSLDYVRPLLGLLSGAVSLSDTVPYVRDILRGRTRPHRGTWLIWATLGIVVVGSQRADGASWSLVMAGTQAALTALVFGLSIRRGEGGLEKSDLLALLVAAAGVAGWYAFDHPVIATACIVFADLIGVGLMLPKAHRDPHSETLSTFVLAGVSGVLAAGAVGSLDATLLLYPVYFFVANGSIALVIWRRRATLEEPTKPRPMH